MRRTGLIATAVLCAGAAGVFLLVANAGPLLPPVGGVGSTLKTLSDIDASVAVTSTNTPGDADSIFKITRPGVYHLIGNVAGAPGRIGIEISASNITLDLRGFEVSGTAGSLAGIDAAGSVLSGLDIGNGTVRGWGSGGIRAGSAAACRLYDLRIVSVAGNGITVGSWAAVERCRISACTGGGLVAGDSAFVRDTISVENSGTGIACGGNSRVVNCRTEFNNVAGITVGAGGLVDRCSARENRRAGISVGLGGTVQNSCAYVNRETGVVTGPAGVVHGCAVYDNWAHGIDCAEGSTVSQCFSWLNSFSGITVASGSIIDCVSLSNGPSGISAGTGGSVVGCVTATNFGDGIVVGPGSTVKNCTSSMNRDNGIAASADCRIRGNQCDHNGTSSSSGAGLYVPAGTAGARVEDNNFTNNDYGLLVQGDGNIVIRNTCTANTVANFSVAAGSSVGTIVNLGAGAEIVTNNSWANFER